jgi:hypothetical protein
MTRGLIDLYFSVYYCHLHQKTSNINVQTLLFNICCRCSCIRYLELPINTTRVHILNNNIKHSFHKGIGAVVP